MRYFIGLSYDGTAYHGWQAQKNAISIQKVLGDALSMMLREEVSLTGCGRTDAGVPLLQVSHWASRGSSFPRSPSSLCLPGVRVALGPRNVEWDHPVDNYAILNLPAVVPLKAALPGASADFEPFG